MTTSTSTTGIPSFNHVGPSTPTAPDNWIFNLNNLAVPPFVHSSVQPPKTELQKFNGEPRRWPLFIQSFKIHVHDALTPDAERLVCLHNLLSAEIQNILGDALLNPGLYPQALKELHRRYGNPQIVAQSCSSTLLNLKPFKDGDTKALLDFSAKLHSVVTTLQYGGYGIELQSCTILRQLVDKLPTVFRSKWAEMSWSLQPRLPSITDFDARLDNKAMAEYHLNAESLYSKTKLKVTH